MTLAFFLFIPTLKRMEKPDPRDTPSVVHHYLCDRKCNDCVLEKASWLEHEEQERSRSCPHCSRNGDWMKPNHAYCKHCEDDMEDAKRFPNTCPKRCKHKNIMPGPGEEHLCIYRKKDEPEEQESGKKRATELIEDTFETEVVETKKARVNKTFHALEKDVIRMTKRIEELEKQKADFWTMLGAFQKRLKESPNYHCYYVGCSDMKNCTCLSEHCWHHNR